MRVAVVDIGTNSTRLLVADVDASGTVDELARQSTVTRLGQGVDASGALAPEAMQRVFDTLLRYREVIDAHGATATTAVLTSAVRDAANGPQFTARVRDDYGLAARTLSGDQEAQLSFLGATSERPPAPLVVIDIGGGSTELVVGAGGAISFFVSTQAGSVRQGERHLRADPPTPTQLAAIGEDVRGVLAAALPADVRASVVAGVAVAGTATQLAAIDQALEPYDPARVHGYRLKRSACERMLEQLAALTELERREVPGLDPARAPTIVVGALIMLEVMRAFNFDEVEVSELDILRGAALELAAGR